MNPVRVVACNRCPSLLSVGDMERRHKAWHAGNDRRMRKLRRQTRIRRIPELPAGWAGVLAAVVAGLFGAFR